jgi:hypothetical protein
MQRTGENSRSFRRGPLTRNIVEKHKDHRPNPL